MSQVKIEKLVYGGAGLGVLNGKACFVQGALPGETVSVRVVRSKSSHMEAVISEIHERSKERVDPPCPYYEKCGGCQWQHLNYEAQLQWKQKILEETLQKIGKVVSPKVLPTLSSPQEFGWRSRVNIHSDGFGKVGFFEPNSHRVVDVERCLVASEVVNQQLLQIRDSLKHIKKDLELRDDGASGFAQVNSLQNEKLKELVLKWAQALPHDFILELFCGNGNFSRELLKISKKFVGVDSAPEGIQKANDDLLSFRRKPESSVFFHCADAAKFFVSYESKTPMDLLLLDPPRDGCGRVVEGVLKHRPKNILYISCNPATLARDIKFLKEFAGYQFVQSQPMDMFPHSYHIESLTLISAS